MTDYKFYGQRSRPSVGSREGVYVRLQAAGLLVFLVLAMGLAGADDLRTAQRRRAAQMAELSVEEKSQVVRLQRAALLATYSTQGMSRAVRLAEVGR